MRGAYITTTGLVLREATYKESSKMLTVLTASEGKLSVSAKGVRRRGSKLAPSAQLLAYSELTLYQGQGGWTLTEARPLELFLGLRDELSQLALGSYFAELLETLSDEDQPDPEILSLGLNALYALSRGLYPAAWIKAAFELRLMCQTGFAPVLEACPVCGREPEQPVLRPGAGAVTCRRCDPGFGGGEQLELTGPALAAMRYVVSAEPKRVFSFRLEGTDLRRLSAACEAYTRIQTERDYGTLRIYNEVRE